MKLLDAIAALCILIALLFMRARSLALVLTVITFYLAHLGILRLFRKLFKREKP